MSNNRFQLILDTENVFLSPVPGSNKIRANITGLHAEQLDQLVNGLIDAGPSVIEEFRKKLNNALKQ